VSSRLAVVRAGGEAPQSLRVAFATGDRRHVDQHFGSAAGFLVYRASARGHDFVEAIRFDPAAEDGGEDKLNERIAALEGCAAVYVEAVGSSAIRRLFAAGVQPVKVDPGLPIAEALAALEGEIREPAALWIARALSGRRDPSRFKALGGEAWDD